MVVAVWLKDGLLDPQGKAVEGALPALGWTNVTDVRVGKRISMTVEAPDADAAREQARQMADRFLSNPVIEVSAVEEVAEAPHSLTRS